MQAMMVVRRARSGETRMERASAATPWVSAGGLDAQQEAALDEAAERLGAFSFGPRHLLVRALLALFA